MSLPCPDCRAPLPDPVGQHCAACGLLLAGPDAGRLYAIDVQIADLSVERASVLAVLRSASPLRQAAHAGSGAGPAVPSQGGPAQGGPAQGGPAEGGPAHGGPAHGGPGWDDPAAVRAGAARSPQRVLLGLGALLVLGAASVFLAVVWLVIGAAGQALIMAGLTVAAGAGAVATHRRGLGSTAATLAWLAAGLTAVDVTAGRDLGLPGLEDLSEGVAIALAAATGTVLAAVAFRRSGMGVFAVQAVLSSALVAPPLLLEAQADAALLVGAVGGWALLALAGRDLAAAAHPAAGKTAGAAGAATLVLAVVLGVLAAANDSTGAAATPGVTTALAALALAGGLREAPRPVPWLTAPVLGVAGTLLAWRTAEAAGLPPAAVLTAAGVLAFLVAGTLLTTGRVKPSAWALAAATTGLLAQAHALQDESFLNAALLSLGLAVAAAAVTAARFSERWVVALAVPVGATAATSALVLALLDAGVGRETVLVVSGALALATGVTAALRRSAPDEPGLGLVAAGTGLCAVLATAMPGLPDLALLRAGLLATGGVLALAYACLPRRGRVAVLGVALSAAASWTLLGDRGVDTLEAYTLPVAALLLIVGGVRARRYPQAASWTTVGPAAAMALWPSAQLAAADPASPRTLVVTAAAVAVLLGGVRVRAQSLVIIAGLVGLEMALVQVGQAALLLPRWVLLGALGSLLLVAGATYEARVQQARAAGTWIRGLR